MATHDLADLLDVGRPATAEHSGDLLEVVRAQQSRTNDRQETGIDIRHVVEAVDHPAPYEQYSRGFRSIRSPPTVKLVTPSKPNAVSSKAS